MGWNGHRWDSASVSILTHSTVQWDGMEWTSLGFPQCVHFNPQYSTVGWDGMDIVGIPPVCPLLPMVQWDGMEWTSLGFPQCVHYFSHCGTVGWDGHLSDSWEYPKNIRTIWDSHCTIGHLLAMLDMSDITSFPVLATSNVWTLAVFKYRGGRPGSLVTSVRRTADTQGVVAQQMISKPFLILSIQWLEARAFAKKHQYHTLYTCRRKLDLDTIWHWQNTMACCIWRSNLYTTFLHSTNYVIVTSLH